MPETSHRPELDEFELHDLALLAPDDLLTAAPDWDLRRETILDEVLPAEPTDSRGRFLRLGIAAAAVAAVGIGGVNLLQSTHQASPAGPSPSASAPQVAGMIEGGRPIAEGHRLLVRCTETVQFEGSATADTLHNLDSYEADGSQRRWQDGRELEPTTSAAAELGQVPADAQKLSAWLLAGKGSTFRPQPASPTTAPMPEGMQQWQGAISWLTNPAISDAMRASLVQLARSSRGVTVSEATLDGRAVLVLDHSAPGWPTTRDTITLAKDSLLPVRRVAVRDSGPATSPQPYTTTTTWDEITDTTQEPRP
ncbi:hypothetical protein [Luteococcus peritonei]|uniref:CU044_5270 family protein n=1 Tax=Luteococcus peritonei TaxID=88874 RepID=A0ABW4RTK5_9ACTN